MKLVAGDHVKMTAKGVKWATTKQSKTLGIDWNKRVGVIERESIVNKTVVYVTWAELTTAREFPRCFLRKIEDARTRVEADRQDDSSRGLPDQDEWSQ